MAELLIYAAAGTGDPKLYQRGDIVVVRETGWSWGALETLPPAQGGRFCRVVISNLTLAQLRTTVGNRWPGADLEGMILSEGIEPQITRRRLLSIDPDTLPAGTRNTLWTTGVISVSLSAVRNYLRNMALGEAL